MLLRKLTEACGAPGQEGEVRNLIRSEIEQYVDELRTDALGNLIAVKNPGAPGPKVMLAAHMDEVALMIMGIEKNGYLRFRPIGGVDPRVLVAKTVVIGEKRVPGVIGSKPIHLQKPEERERPLSLDELLIDIGAKSQEEQKSWSISATVPTSPRSLKNLGKTRSKPRPSTTASGARSS